MKKHTYPLYNQIKQNTTNLIKMVVNKSNGQPAKLINVFTSFFKM